MNTLFCLYILLPIELTVNKGNGIKAFVLCTVNVKWVFRIIPFTCLFLTTVCLLNSKLLGLIFTSYIYNRNCFQQRRFSPVGMGWYHRTEMKPGGPMKSWSLSVFCILWREFILGANFKNRAVYSASVGGNLERGPSKTCWDLNKMGHATLSSFSLSLVLRTEELEGCFLPCTPWGWLCRYFSTSAVWFFSCREWFQQASFHYHCLTAE